MGRHGNRDHHPDQVPTDTSHDTQHVLRGDTVADSCQGKGTRSLEWRHPSTDHEVVEEGVDVSLVRE